MKRVKLSKKWLLKNYYGILFYNNTKPPCILCREVMFKTVQISFNISQFLRWKWRC